MMGERLRKQEKVLRVNEEQAGRKQDRDSRYRRNKGTTAKSQCHGSRGSTWVQESEKQAMHKRQDLENDTRKHLLRDYQLVKQLTGHKNRQVAAVKSKEGELLKNKEARKERYREYFQEVLNIETPKEPPQEGKKGEEIDI